MITESETTEAVEQIIPEPGIYEDIPADDYHKKWNAASKSALDYIAEWSPMHLDYFRKHPAEPTEALIFGSPVHTAILEPDKFEESVVIATQCCGVKADGVVCKNAGNILSGGRWFCGVHGRGRADESAGKNVITQAQLEQIQNIVRAVSFNAAANGLLTSEGPNELSAAFDHPENGLRCKMRADGYRPEWSAILDIKTTDCAAKKDFERSIMDYGYHRQAAFYQDGLALCGIKVTTFAFITVEKKAPYGVATYRLMDDAIQAGREENKRLVRIYKNCQDSGKWYGYASDFQDISISSWRMRQIINGEF